MKVLFKIIGNLLTFILSIIFLGIIIMFSSILFLKNSITEKQINNYINEIDILSVEANDIFNGEYKNNETLKDVLVLELSEKGVPKNLTTSIIESEELYKFVSKYSNLYINYILQNSEKPIVTENDFTKIVNANIIEESLGRSLSEHEKKELSSFVTSTTKVINDELVNRSEFIKTNNYDKLIAFIFGVNFNIYIIIGLIVIFLLMCLFTWSLYRPFMFTAIPTIICGFIYIILFGTAKIGIKYLIKTDGTIENVIKKAIDLVNFNVLITGFIILGIGIFMIIIYKILKQIFYKEVELFFKEEEDNRVNPKIKAKKLC